MTPTRPPTAGTPVRRWSRLFVAGVLAWLVALALVAPHLTSGTELVRLRHALALGPDLAVDADWQPPQWPVDYMQDGPTPDPYFVAIAEGLGLAAMPDDWTRGRAIARHLLGSAPALLGGAIQHDLRHTYEAIVQRGYGYCGDFIRAYTAIAHAAGLPMRTRAFSFDGFGGHGHIWVEIWNRDRARWQLIDVFQNYYYADGSEEPLSALELRASLQSGSASLRLLPLHEGVPPGWAIEAKAKDYLQRGLAEWYIPWGSAVFKADASWPTRWFGGLSRAAENLGHLVVGAQPGIRMLATAESSEQRAGIRALRQRLQLAGVLVVVGLVLLVAFALTGRRRMVASGAGDEPAVGRPGVRPDTRPDPRLGTLLIYSPLFPHRGQPQAGLFIRERMFRVAPPERLVVVSPQPWFPLQGLLRIWKPGYRPLTPRYECQAGVDVWFPRFLSIPGVLRRLDGLSMAVCTWPLMRRLKRERGASLVDAHFAYPAGYAAVRLGQWLNLPVTITLRGTEVRHLREPALRHRVLVALKGADLVYSVSESLRQCVGSAGADLGKIRVVGNGVDLQKFQRLPAELARQRLGIALDVPVLITVGGLVERKGFHRVIEVLPRLRERFPGLIYLIVGGGSPEGDISARLKDQVAELNLSGAVQFLGPMAPEDLHLPLSAANVFVLPTANEGWANVLLEAMACGLPVVTTDVGGNKEVVCHAWLGSVVAFGQPDLLEEAVSDAINHPWDHSRIMSYAQQNDWSRRVAVLQQCFSEVLAQHAGTPFAGRDAGSTTIA